MARASAIAAACLVLATGGASCRSDVRPEWSSFVSKFADQDPDTREIPDWSKEGLERSVAWYKGQIAEALKFEASRLSPEQRLELAHLIAICEAKLFWLVTARSRSTNPASYARALGPPMATARAQAGESSQAFLAYARAVPRACEQIRSGLELPLSKPLLERGIIVFDGLAAWVRRAALQLALEPSVRNEIQAAAQSASEALAGVARWLEAERGSAKPGFVLGRDALTEMLRAVERVSAQPAEIEAAGREELERDSTALASSCRAFAPKASLARCAWLAERSGGVDDPLGVARAEVAELEGFIRAHDVIAIPPGDPVTVKLVGDGHPGSIGLLRGSTYLIAGSSPDGTAPSETYLLDVTAHETWPGHYLQDSYARSSPSRLVREYRSNLSSEGWANYAEELIYTGDFGRDFRKGNTQARVSQRLAALLRDVRLLVVLGVHSGRMTVSGAELLFQQRAFLSPGEARGQAERSIDDPLELDYTLGKLMIQKLGRDWCARNAPVTGSCQKAFHEKFLSYGPIPIPLVRAAMLGSADDGKAF